MEFEQNLKHFPHVLHKSPESKQNECMRKGRIPGSLSNLSASDMPVRPRDLHLTTAQLIFFIYWSIAN